MPGKPAPPTALRAHVLEDGRVRVIWNHFASDDVAEYRIYVGRSNQRFEEFKWLASVPSRDKPSRNGDGADKTWDTQH